MDIDQLTRNAKMTWRSICSSDIDTLDSSPQVDTQEKLGWYSLPYPKDHGPVHGVLLGARTLLGAPGLTTRNKKLLGAPGIVTRSMESSRALGLIVPWR